MDFWTFFLAWATCLASIASAAPLTSPKASGSEINTWTAIRNSTTHFNLDILRDLAYTKSTEGDSSPSTVSDATEPTQDIAPRGAAIEGITGLFKNDSIPATGDSGTEPHWKYSLQILFREYNGYFSWYMYQGPFGVPVNPCGDQRFRIIVNNFRETRKGLSLMEPPMVGDGTKWYVNSIEGWSDRGQCRYEAAANDPGHLVCGDFFDYPVSKDAGYDSKPIRCARGKWADGTYHRAWVVEF
jgi:hypothetical protein